MRKEEDDISSVRYSASQWAEIRGKVRLRRRKSLRLSTVQPAVIQCPPLPSKLDDSIEVNDQNETNQVSQSNSIPLNVDESVVVNEAVTLSVQDNAESNHHETEEEEEYESPFKKRKSIRRRRRDSEESLTF